MNQQNNPASKRRLGRGLSSLMKGAPGATSTTNSTDEVKLVPKNFPVTSGSPVEIAIDQIAPNPHQPRRDFDETQLAELAQSIRHDGILQPLIVAPAKEGQTPEGKTFVLIAGERRLRAAKRAGLSNVPCIQRDATEQQMVEWAVIENIQRSDLNPIERATAYRDCMDRFNLTQESVAERLGQARGTVANYLRMLDLADETQTLIATGQISFGHAKVLGILIGQAERQVQFARRIVAEGMSVRKLEEYIKEVPKQPKAELSDEKKSSSKPAYVRDVEQQLTETVGTRVTILPGRSKNSGKIVIEYYTLDDFDRIAGNLGLNVED